MAEWFKAADLRPAIVDAWVRTPLSATHTTYVLKGTYAFVKINIKKNGQVWMWGNKNPASSVGRAPAF